jgi:hypothetical protein
MNAKGMLLWGMASCLGVSLALSSHAIANTGKSCGDVAMDALVGTVQKLHIDPQNPKGTIQVLYEHKESVYSKASVQKEFPVCVEAQKSPNMPVLLGLLRPSKMTTEIGLCLKPAGACIVSAKRVEGI